MSINYTGKTQIVSLQFILNSFSLYARTDVNKNKNESNCFKKRPSFQAYQTHTATHHTRTGERTLHSVQRTTCNLKKKKEEKSTHSVWWLNAKHSPVI